METELLVRDEAGRKGVSLQRLKFVLFGPKTESFAPVVGPEKPCSGNQAALRAC